MGHPCEFADITKLWHPRQPMLLCNWLNFKHQLYTQDTEYLGNHSAFKIVTPMGIPYNIKGGHLYFIF